MGTCHHLLDSDVVFSTHRCHAHYLAKGGSLERMALELHGKVGGCMDGRGGSMHLMDKNIMSIPIVSSAIPLAVGAALANKIDGNGNIVVCFSGDAAALRRVFFMSRMNFCLTDATADYFLYVRIMDIRWILRLRKRHNRDIL